MNLTKSERPHIAFFGCTNSGKSSLVNAVTNQALSVVSDVKGTTTDAVQKAMEILPLGPVVIIDTAGVNDGVNDGDKGVNTLGQLRVDATMRILDKTDIAVLVVDSTVGVQKEDEELIREFKERKIPYITVFNKCDLTSPSNPNLSEKLQRFGFSSAESQEAGEIYPLLEGGSKSLISGWGKNASHKFNQDIQANAIKLRNNATKQEKKLWQYLNKSQLGYKFRRQQPIGNYIVDFFCSTLKLIIELDGGQHNEKQSIEYDNKRTRFLNQLGYKVIRIWNNDIDKNIEGVVEYIKSELTPPPTPLPQGAGEPSLSTPDTLSTLPQGAGEGLSSCETESFTIPQGDGVCLFVSAKTGEGVNELREKLGHLINENKKEKYIIKDKLTAGDVVILVIPIDESAPKGRIILPQQNVLRECLDAHASAICCQVEELEQILKTITPNFVITDSQAFNKVKEIVPENIILTSFSILMANYRGKLNELVCAAETISKLKDGDTVLISEACTHHRQCNDIGTVKLPKWIKDFSDSDLNFEFTQGGEFPADLSKYKLIVHCGGCMINEAEMKSRQQKAKEQKIPMVNYGMAIAYMNGILDRALQIFK